MNHPPARRIPSRLPTRRTAVWRIPAGGLVALIVVLILSTPAAATWSIIAVDPESGEVGAAMAACSAVSVLGEPDEVPALLVLVPGRGVAAAHGAVDPADLDQFRTVLADSTVSNADEVIARVVDDNDSELQTIRQYSVVLDGSTAVADGAETEPAALALTGPTAGAQGVALASDAVVEDSLAAFAAASADGQPLADALVAGLEAGAAAGGDRNCGDQTALFAHVSVVGPNDDGLTPERLLTVTVDEGDGRNPVELLAQAHREGRTGWIDAGDRAPTTVPRVAVLAIGVVMAVASVLIIRRGLGHRRRPAA